MGRIKTQYIKRLTHKLMERHGEQITEDYEKNKEIVGKLFDLPSKKIRNVIAGYSTRLAKMKKIN